MEGVMSNLSAEGVARLDPFHQACCHWQTVYESSVADPEGSVRLHDHFSATVELRIAEIQPQYGLVQLNAMRLACGCLVSCDVKRDDFLSAVAKVLGVTITDAEASVTPAPTQEVDS
jgi:hypothetical protein